MMNPACVTNEDATAQCPHSLSGALCPLSCGTPDAGVPVSAGDGRGLPACSRAGWCLQEGMRTPILGAVPTEPSRKVGTFPQVGHGKQPGSLPVLPRAPRLCPPHHEEEIHVGGGVSPRSPRLPLPLRHRCERSSV